MTHPATDPQLKESIVTEAYGLFDKKYNHQSIFPRYKDGSQIIDHQKRGRCLYYTACLIGAAHRAGIQLIPQAGSASFLRLPRELDDGKETTLTHFSYEWQNQKDEEIEEKYLSRGILPEMHVWAACPATMELIDISVKHIPEQCKITADMEWLTPKPPDYVWGTMEQMPEFWSYRATPEACVFSLKLFNRYIIGQ